MHKPDSSVRNDAHQSLILPIAIQTKIYSCLNHTTQAKFRALRILKIKHLAFTLIELLLVSVIILILAGLLLPAISKAKEYGRRIECISNIRQIGMSNTAYTGDNNAFFVDSGDYLGQKSRWHGKRKTINDPFDFDYSPLKPYMKSGAIKECPSKTDFVKVDEWDMSYEKGCGGYGYNFYVGGTGGMGSIPVARTTDLEDPTNTIMFCDTASTKGGQLIEYSAATAPWYDFSNPAAGTYFFLTSTPNCHFRHVARTCNVAWTDGHATSEKRAFFRDGTEPLGEKFNVGFIGKMADLTASGGGGTMYFSRKDEVYAELSLYDLSK